jgi:hypothetical protein
MATDPGGTTTDKRVRAFHLHRFKDHTGVSGRGCVAEGALFSDGSVALRWHSATASTAVYGSLDDVAAVHGHNGDTEIVWEA